MRILVHGVDLVEVERIAAMLEEHGRRFIDRCFTETEQAYADAAPRARAQRFAVRFACKEAVLKALGTGWSGGITWRDMEVRRRPSGEPELHLGGRCAELAVRRGIRRWALSLSHTRSSAVASVIGLGDG